jgi:hypothetical protein
MTHNARQHEGRGGRVIFRKLAFRDVANLRDHPVRIAYNDFGCHQCAGLGFGDRRFCFFQNRRGHWFLLFDFSGILVLAQPLK